MKIGIITFWDSQDNYGQVLQSFALQHYLKLCGHDAFLIRYKLQANKRNHLDKTVSLLKKISPNYLKSYYKYILNKKTEKKYNKDNPRHFEDFKHRFISFSSKQYNGFVDLDTEIWDLDAFICGSDQIWSPSLSHENLRSFFLQFNSGTAKILSYAASIGRSKVSPEYLEQLTKFLFKFDSISLREEASIGLCNKANRSDAKLVCDPTLLLNLNDYSCFFKNEFTPKNNSLFIYLLNWETMFPIQEVREFAEMNNFKINFIGAHGIEKRKLFSPLKDLRVESWIQNIFNSKLVFTNSFHGMVFSILFNCPFVVFPLDGTSKEMNSRFTSLLSKLGLESRIYDSSKTIKEIINQPIDWLSINEKIEKFRKHSKQFLEEALMSNG